MITARDALRTMRSSVERCAAEMRSTDRAMGAAEVHPLGRVNLAAERAEFEASAATLRAILNNFKVYASKPAAEQPAVNKALRLNRDADHGVKYIREALSDARTLMKRRLDNISGTLPSNCQALVTQVQEIARDVNVQYFENPSYEAPHITVLTLAEETLNVDINIDTREDAEHFVHSIKVIGIDDALGEVEYPPEVQVELTRLLRDGDTVKFKQKLRAIATWEKLIKKHAAANLREVLRVTEEEIRITQDQELLTSEGPVDVLLRGRGLVSRFAEGPFVRYWAPASAYADGDTSALEAQSFGFTVMLEASTRDVLLPRGSAMEVDGAGAGAGLQPGGVPVPVALVARLTPPVMVTRSVALALANVPFGDVGFAADQGKPGRIRGDTLQGLVAKHVSGSLARISSTGQITADIIALDMAQQIQHTSAGERGFLIERIPFTRVDQIPEIQGVLRQSLVFNEILGSCFCSSTSGEDTPMMDGFSCFVDLSTSAPACIAVTVRHPATGNMMTLQLNIAPGGAVEVSCRLLRGDPPLVCGDEFLNKIVNVSHSLPLSLHCMYRKCNSRIES